MTNILLVSFIYVLVYAIDYGRFDILRKRYEYVSRETLFLFIFGILLLLGVFHMELATFFSHNITTEAAIILGSFSFSLLTTTILYKTDTKVCYTIVRSEHCLVPLYTFVKGKDILFQQLAFLLLALFVSHETGTTLLGYITYMLLLAITHIPIVLSSVNNKWKYGYIIGISLLSFPFFYSYTVLGLFWPAVILHGIISTFVWIAIASDD